MVQAKKSKGDNGIALSITCIIILVFLYFTPSYFRYELITRGIGVIFGIIGIIGFCIEMERKLNSKIEGFTDFSLGIILLLIWGITYLNTNSVWVNIGMFFFLVLGIYGCSVGISKVIISIRKQQIVQENSKIKLISIENLVAFTTLVFTMLQIFQIILSRISL